MKSKKRLTLNRKERQHVTEVLNRSKRPILEKPLIAPDLDREEVPVITTSEMAALLSAYQILQIAKADFDAKHGAVKLQMLHLGKVDSINFDGYLDRDGIVVIKDLASVGKPEVTRIVPIFQ